MNVKPSYLMRTSSWDIRQEKKFTLPEELAVEKTFKALAPQEPIEELHLK
jgi:hypothetical protein